MVGVSTAFRDVTVMSETQGKVLKMNTEVGNKVAAGQVLVEVDDELKLANLKTAQANYDKAKKDLERFEQLLKENASTEMQVEGVRLQLKLAEAQLTVAKRQVEDTKIKAPIAGVVTAKMTDIGQMLGGGSPIVSIADLSKVKVKVAVSEKDVFKLRKGQAVSVTTDVYPNQVFAGTIYTISDKGDEAHTYNVEILLPNSANSPLKAGMFCNVDFKLGAQRKSIVVPRTAIDGSLREPFVYAVVNGKAVRKKVTVGIDLGTKVEILNGLEVGEAIVSSGLSNLSDGMAVVISK
jgi:RND family efflux transporter MFP subunit